MKILNLIKITSGGMHGWYETDLGFPIRKLLGSVKGYAPREPQSEQSAEIVSETPSKQNEQKSWWKRFKKIWEFLKNLFS